ncbi:MAG: GIY-YIG nuclease family protein [Thiobacillus sp.]|nr:GIY-YIG nuclease family protein [Thiobacillus sp.]
MSRTSSKVGIGIDLSTESLPFETEALRAALQAFLDVTVDDPRIGKLHKIGSYKWGVYAFFDYDGEPIYVGQTNEMLRTRIRRHLTNRRTDAVAMNVLDPVEVCHVEIWPLPQYQGVKKDDLAAKKAKAHLNALEYTIFQKCIEQSTFKAILNEKEPPAPTDPIQPPLSFRGKIVTEEISRLRDHPDLRIARRASVMARLAQIISERKVQKGLRRALLTQAERLRWLAEQRYSHAADSDEND